MFGSRSWSRTCPQALELDDVSKLSTKSSVEHTFVNVLATSPYSVVETLAETSRNGQARPGEAKNLRDIVFEPRIHDCPPE